MPEEPRHDVSSGHGLGRCNWLLGPSVATVGASVATAVTGRASAVTLNVQNDGAVGEFGAGGVGAAFEHNLERSAAVRGIGDLVTRCCPDD